MIERDGLEMKIFYINFILQMKIIVLGKCELACESNHTLIPRENLAEIFKPRFILRQIYSTIRLL